MSIEKENIPTGCGVGGNMADVRKSGYLKKLKTMRKKFFVLRGESSTGPARLEYYDNEKKFRAGSLTKRTIYLRSCFNINRKSDAKNKWALALYTRDDCFSMVADDEESLTEWLQALLEQQQVGLDGIPVPAFEHVWQVSVKPKGLGSSKNLSGSYRLCLTSTTINLVKMSCENEDFEFSLSTIRRCGHSDCFFFMEVGRQAATGAGELWMQVEDTVIAQNIHEAALNAMRSISQEEMRPRSQSGSSSDGKPMTSSRRQPTTLGPSWRARCDSMPVGTRPTRTSLTRLSSHESDEGTVPKEETSPSSSSSSVIRPRTRSEGESGQFRSQRSASGGSSLLKYGSKLRPRTASEGESHFRTGRTPESPTKGRGRFSNIRNSTSSLRPTSVHRITAQPMSNSPPIPNSPLSESPSQQGIAEERYVTYGPGDVLPDEYGYGNSPAGEPHYSRPHHGSLRCRTPESPTHTPIREESIEIADEYMNMSPSASSKALPVPQGRRFSGSSGISSMNRFGTFPFRHHGHHHHHQHILTAGSVESEPSLGHSSSPYEPDSYMAMNPGHQKRSNSAGFLCTNPTASTNNNSSSTTTNHRSGSIGSKEMSSNGNEGYMMMAPSTKGSRPGSRRGSGSIETPVIRHTSMDEPESYMMMTPSSSRSSSISGRPDHSGSHRSASLDIPSSTAYRTVSPSHQLSTDSYMNMEFQQTRRANSLDKDAGLRMRGHRHVTRTASNTSSEEPASYMNVSFSASSPKSASENEGYAYMEPSSKKAEGTSGTLSSITGNVPQSADGTPSATEKEGEYVNVNFDQRKKSSSQPVVKRNIPPALVLKNSPSDTSEYMNVEPGPLRRSSPSSSCSPTSPAAQALRIKTLEKSLEEVKLHQGSPGKSSVGSPKSSPRSSTSSAGSPHSGSPRLSSHNGVRNLVLGGCGQSRSCEPSPRLSSRQSGRRSSDSSSPVDEKELNYIDVDIGAPGGKAQSNIERRARSPFHRRSTDEDKQAEPTNYATIDFTKSEGLRVMTNKRQHESRH